MIGRSGERGSGISMLVARHDDDINVNSPLFRITIISLKFLLEAILNDGKLNRMLQH